jgi:hypothetical protein
MGVPINNVTRRVVYAASGTGPYNFTFEILAASDIAVYRDDSLLTLTTDYSVTINSNGTGFVTLTATPTGATQIAIVGNRSIQRTTDFVTGGDFFANTLNDELDQQTIFSQQNAEGLQRALIAPQTDPTTIDMTLPRASVRANKTLAFDANGDPTTGEVIGDNRGNWAAGVAYNKRDIIKDTSNGNIYYANTSHTSTGSQPISTNADSAKWDLIVDNASAATSATAAAASASAAATSASNASTSATNASNSATTASTQASNASTSASNASTSATAAAASATAAAASFDAFDDIYLGAKASNPTVDNDGNALTTGDQYFNTVSNELRVWNGSTWQAASTVGGTVASLSVTGNTTLGDASADTLTINATVEPGMIISGTTTSAALRITQLGTGNALVVEDSTNPDSTPFVVNADGRIISGHTSSLAIGSDTSNIQTNAGSSTNNGYATTNWTGSTGSSNFNFAKSRSTTIGTPSIVLSGDSLGKAKFFGDDGVGFIEAARIEAVVDGTPGTNDMPGRLVFSTSADGSATPTERMRIDSSGNVGIGTSSPTAKVQIFANGAPAASGNMTTGMAVASAAGSFAINIGADATAGYTWLNSAYINASNTASPMVFMTGATERARIDSSGNLLVTNAAGLGYGTGAGGTVTQATNKATAVTLNKPTGQITTSNAALGAGAAASFSVLNSVVAASDVVVLTGTNSPDTNNYRIEAFNVAAGGFGIRLINITGGSRSEAVVINFAIIKGATT